jgi:hypothetical protein
MTASNVTVLRPADAPPPGPEWKPIPGAPGYEASHRGKYRSVDRESAGGRKLRGKELSQRLGNQVRDGGTQYMIGDVRREDGSKWTDTVHSFVLRAHDRAPEPGEECCHGPGGPLDNRWPENIRWGTKAENEADKPRPVREPKPRTPCVNHARCGGYVTSGGRRCHPCVVLIGQGAAALLEEEPDLAKAAGLLGYSSPEGVFKLAVRYGGLRCVVDQAAITPSEPGVSYAPSPQRRSRSVLIRLRAWLADSDPQ